MKWEPAHTNPEDRPSRSLRLHHRLIIAAIVILCIVLLALASKRAAKTAPAAISYSAAPAASAQ